MPVEIEKDWIAVRGERIVAKGRTKEEAQRVAEYFEEDYELIVAVPKRSTGSYV